MRLAGRHRTSYRAISSWSTCRGQPSHCIRAFSTHNALCAPLDVIGDVERRPHANPRAENIAVLGGGITGLTTAHYLARTIPQANITIFEQKDKLGGWISSEVVKVDEGEVLFEWGPRSIRPDHMRAGRATTPLLYDLGLASHGEEESVITIPKNSPAASNRYIYYPDHLVKMPGPQPGASRLVNLFNNVYNLLTEPIFKGILPAMIREPLVQLRPNDVSDESVGAFVERRYGKTAADNLASAIIHGIYAGDLYKLSARTLFSYPWYLETRDSDGSGINAEMADLMFKQHSLTHYKDVRFHNLMLAAGEHVVPSEPRMEGNNIPVRMDAPISVYTFTKGVEQLVQRLIDRLTGENNSVICRTGTSITGLKFDTQTKKTTITSEGDESESSEFDYVVSTLPPKTLLNLLEHTTIKPSEDQAEPHTSPVTSQLKDALNATSKATTVMVVNLYYSNPDLIPPSMAGFGYLVPRSVPVDQNPERALGVLFSSETSGPRGKDAYIQIETATPHISVEKMDEFSARLTQSLGMSNDRAVQVLNTFMDLRLQNNQASYDEKIHELEQILHKRGGKWTSVDVRQLMNQLVDEASVLGSKEENEDNTVEKSSSHNKPRRIRIGQDTAPGTKLTVMLGGHWWDNWTTSDLPTEEEAIDMAKSVLARHLKIFENPLVAKARLNRDCIPQYPVGYRTHMATIHNSLVSDFQGRLKVAGSWWCGGVGVNDCIRSARYSAFAVREEWDDETGLKEYTEKEKFVLRDGRTGAYMMDPLGQQ